MLFGRSPLRISFGGGGTDLEEYHNSKIGHALSATIDKYTYVFAKLRNDSKFQAFSPDFASHIPPNHRKNLSLMQGHEIALACMRTMKFQKGIDIFFCSDVAPGSGLGASSSLATNLIKVILEIQGKTWNKDQIAIKAHRIARDILKWKIGKQDEFAAVYGGVNFLTFKKNKVIVEPIILSHNLKIELQKHSMLFYLGRRKSASDVLENQLSNMKNSNNTTMRALDNAKIIALEMRDALKENDLTKFYYLIKKGWEEKKKYASTITNNHIDLVCKKALSSGADALKVTGAGGGGHLFILADPSKHNLIEKELKKVGTNRVHFNYQNQGSSVFNLDSL